jgi:hypothetical protein
VLRHVEAAAPDAVIHLGDLTDSGAHEPGDLDYARLPDETQPVLGAKRCGIMTLELADGAAPQHAMVEPDGLRQLTLPADTPDPDHP